MTSTVCMSYKSKFRQVFMTSTVCMSYKQILYALGSFLQHAAANKRYTVQSSNQLVRLGQSSQGFESPTQRIITYIHEMCKDVTDSLHATRSGLAYVHVHYCM